jgi:hypothetical protein
MPQLRRLAIAAENPAKLVAFYQEVFELDKIEGEKEAVFLSDGTFSLALLPVRDGMSMGLSGLGFETTRVESIRNKLATTAVSDQSLEAMASISRKRAGMCEATTKVPTVQSNSLKLPAIV